MYVISFYYCIVLYVHFAVVGAILQWTLQRVSLE